MADNDSDSEPERFRARRRSTQRRRKQEEAWLAPQKAPERGPDGLFLRPAGRAPVTGYEWNSARGVWIPGKRLLDEMHLAREQTVRRRPSATKQKRVTNGSRQHQSQEHHAEVQHDAAARPKRNNRKRASRSDDIQFEDVDSTSEAPSSSAGVSGRDRGRRVDRQQGFLPPPVVQVNFHKSAVDDETLLVNKSVVDDETLLAPRKRVRASPSSAPLLSHASANQSNQEELDNGSDPMSGGEVAGTKTPLPSLAPPLEILEDPYHPGSMWKEPKPDPFDADLTLYEKERKPRPAPTGRFQCSIPLLKQEFRCVVCLDYMTNARIVRECLHRFCEACIEKCLVQGRKECPICRVHIPSRRSLAPDPDFDKLIQHIVRDNHADQHDEEAHEVNVATRASHILQRAIRNRLARPNKGSAQAEEGISNGEEASDEENEEQVLDADRQDEKMENASDSELLDPSPEYDDDSPNVPTLIKIVLIRLPKERTILEDLQMPFLTLSGDAPVSVLQHFLRQKYGFRFANFDILLYFKNCGGTPITAPSEISLREFVTTHSRNHTLDNAAGYLPLHFRVSRLAREVY